jgi:hypothetical protein
MHRKREFTPETRSIANEYSMIRQGRMTVIDFELLISAFAKLWSTSTKYAMAKFIHYLKIISMDDTHQFTFYQYLVHYYRWEILEHVLSPRYYWYGLVLSDIERLDLVIAAVRRNGTKTLKYLLRDVQDVPKFLRFDIMWRVSNRVKDFITDNAFMSYIYKVHQAHKLPDNTDYLWLNIIVSRTKRTDSQRNLRFILEQYKIWSGLDTIEVGPELIEIAFDYNHYTLIPVLLDYTTVSTWPNNTTLPAFITKLITQIHEPIIRRILLQLRLKYAKASYVYFGDVEKNRSLLHFAIMYDDLPLLKLILNNYDILEKKALIHPDKYNALPVDYVNDYNIETINYLHSHGIIEAYPKIMMNKIALLLRAVKYRYLLLTQDEGSIHQTLLFSDLINYIAEFCELPEIYTMMSVCKHWCTTLIDNIYSPKNSTNLNIVLVDSLLEAEPLLQLVLRLFQYRQYVPVIQSVRFSIHLAVRSKQRAAVCQICHLLSSIFKPHHLLFDLKAISRDEAITINHINITQLTKVNTNLKSIEIIPVAIQNFYDENFFINHLYPYSTCGVPFSRIKQHDIIRIVNSKLLDSLLVPTEWFMLNISALNINALSNIQELMINQTSISTLVDLLILLPNIKSINIHVTDNKVLQETLEKLKEKETKILKFLTSFQARYDQIFLQHLLSIDNGRIGRQLSTLECRSISFASLSQVCPNLTTLSIDTSEQLNMSKLRYLSLKNTNSSSMTSDCIVSILRQCPELVYISIYNSIDFLDVILENRSNNLKYITLVEFEFRLMAKYSSYLKNSENNMPIKRSFLYEYIHSTKEHPLYIILDNEEPVATKTFANFEDYIDSILREKQIRIQRYFAKFRPQ